MRRAALLAIGVLILLLLSNGAVLAAQSNGQQAGTSPQVSQNAVQQNDVPKDRQSTEKLVTENKVVSEKDGLTLVESAERIADASSQLTDSQSTVAASPSSASGGRSGTVGDNYAFTGHKWDLSKYPAGVPYIINPSGATARYGLSQAAVVSAIKSSFQTWDAAAGRNIFTNNPSVSYVAQVGPSEPDFKNVVTWGSLQSGTVAETYMWVNTTTGRYADVDLVFNTAYRWGIDPDGEGPQHLPNSTVDIRDACTHEAGHWAGLGDLYDQNSSTETMYGYVSYGETQKMSLAQGDIDGVRALYR
ncbi:MAG: matrixin family metalloprotease [Halobacteriota archaeon]